MDMGEHDLPALFSQLGLASDQDSIQRFISGHSLPPGTPLAKAGFWTRSQARFLEEALIQDAEWAEAADEMAILLTKPRH